jgi:hypothetical protein
VLNKDEDIWIPFPSDKRHKTKDSAHRNPNRDVEDYVGIKEALDKCDK